MTEPLTRRISSRAPWVIVSILCAIVGSSEAQTSYIFDSSHPQQVWNSTSTDWSGIPWSNNNHAQFTQSGSTLDIDVNIVATQISFGQNGYVLQNANSINGTLTIGASGVISVNDAAHLAEISEVLAGSSWTKSGAVS